MLWGRANIGLMRKNLTAMFGLKITFPHDRGAISDSSGCRQWPRMAVNVRVCSYMPPHVRMSPYMPLNSLQRVVLAHSY